VQILKVGTAARAAGLLAARIFHQGIDLDDIGAPIRELPDAGRPGADAGEIKHGKAGKGLGGVWEGHSGLRGGTEIAASSNFAFSIPYWQPILQMTTTVTIHAAVRRFVIFNSDLERCGFVTMTSFHARAP
jgi:hypothetical protein